MKSRERVLLALKHKEADRIAIHDAPWQSTIWRWHKEGLPMGMTPHTYFNYELDSVGVDLSFQLEPELLEETEECTIVRGPNGAIVKNWKYSTSTPETIDFTIKDRKKWEELKTLLRWNYKRVDWVSGLNLCKMARDRGQFFMYAGGIGYDQTQGIVGSERLLVAMAEDSAWVKDMFSTSAQMIIESAEEMMGNGFIFDGAFLYDDMGYRNASLFSPKMYKELLQPVHKKVCDFFHGKGIPLILHSCGCVKDLIPYLIEAGFDCLQPLEVKAGMDLIELKKKYGEVLAFMGGIDVRKMCDPDPKMIEGEISAKINFAKKGGGYIYHSDHSVPDNVSFEQYCKAIDLVKQYGKY